MSYYEAKEDNIPITKDSKGMNYYHPPCHVCGSPVVSWSYIRGQRYCCSDCRVILVLQYRAEKDEMTIDKKRKKDS